MKKNFAIIGVLAFSAAAILGILANTSVAGHAAMLAALWAGTAALVAYAVAGRTLTPWIVAAMAVGVLVGYQWPEAAIKTQVLAQIFLRLIKVIVAPLLFATLVSGIARHSDLKRLGRLGLKAVIYFELVTTAALFIGLAAINISRAGVGVQAATAGSAPAEQLARPAASTVILNAFPESIAKSAAEGQVLQVVVFSIIFAIALALVPEAKRAPMLNFCESLAEVMFRFTNIVMLYAPIGVGSAIAFSVAQGGIGVLGALARLVATFYIALSVFLLAVLLPVALVAHVPLRRFLAAVAEPASIAFSTSSSEAALPRAMESMEALGVPRQIVAFVIPTGYSFNLDGSTLYLSLAAVFVARVAGIPLTLHQQLAIVLTLMLASKGVAGVSKSSLVILLGAVASLGLPAAPVLLLFGVDQILDMARTGVNVVGNCLASVVVATSEREFVLTAPASFAEDETAG